MVNKIEKQILEYKKDLFIKEVVKAAMSLETPIPIVKFWQYYENHHFDKGERAHIHIPENIICISEPELNNMTEEDIRKTASHEVSHLHYLDHGWEFQQTHEQTEQSMFEPPTGNVGALPENYERPEKKPEKEIIIKNKCNFCGKKEKTKQCRYCKYFFCKNHVDAREAGLSKSYAINENTHPCLAYNNYLIEKEKTENEEYKKALDKMFGRKKEIPREITEREIPKAKEKEEKREEKTSFKKTEKPKTKENKSFLEKFFKIRLVDD